MRKHLSRIRGNLSATLFVLSAVLGLGIGTAASGAEALSGAEAVGILQARCMGCHNGDAPKGGLHLDSREGALVGGNSGDPAIVPTQAMASRMVKLITQPIEHPKVMPPKSMKRPTGS